MSAFHVLLRGAAVVSVLVSAHAAFALEAPGFGPDADASSAETMKAAGEMVLAYDTEITGAISSTSRAAPNPSVSSNDVAQIRAAIQAFERGDAAGARALRAQVSDPGAVTLLDWLQIRLASRTCGFAQIDAFYRVHRDWPLASMVRRRAEEALWLENVPAPTVRAFFAANGKPERAEGKLALARALLAAGDRGSAASLAKDAYRSDGLDGPLEQQALSTFGPMFSAADHRARAEMRFLSDEVDAGMRAATRAGGSYVAIARARAAVIRKLPNAAALLA
ncbi:MAG: lytic transglycosylase domain-containing protein, partial [Hansschlegelia sp.]